MQTLIITGSNASGVIIPPNGLGVEFRNIDLDFPSGGSGILTLSGVSTGAVALHTSTDSAIRFKTNEQIDITSDFGTTSTAMLGYVTFGDETWVFVDLNRTQQIGRAHV